MEARRPGAVGLVRLALAGSILAAATAFLGLVHVPVLAHGCGFWEAVWAYRFRILVFLVPLLTGLALVWAEKRFRRGYGIDLWTEPELAQVRALVGQRIWGVVGLVATLLWIALLVRQHSFRGGAFWYPLILPSQTVQRIRSLITPRVTQSSGLMDWRNSGPLRSEHWGERNA